MNKQIFFIIGILMLASVVSAAESFRDVNTQFYQPTLTTYYTDAQVKEYWPFLYNKDEVQCYGRQDFIVQIAPAGCQPTVVRSDLLEEQNVPVFCKLNAVQINPLINVKSIDRIIPDTIGKKPDEISSVGYYPARAAVRSYDNLLGSPLINDIGYAVVVLKRNPVEKNMPDYVTANMTAVIKYDMGNAWGVGRAEYYLPLLSDADWQRDYKKYEFWRGKGYLRLDWEEVDRVQVSVYTDATHRVASKILKKGETSDYVYLPGYYCMAALQLKMNDFSSAETSAILQVNDDKVEVRTGQRFFDNKCQVLNIDEYNSAGKVEVSCENERAVLSFDNSDVSLRVKTGDAYDDGRKYSIGGKIISVTEDVPKNVYLAYFGTLPASVAYDKASASASKRQFIVLVKTSEDENSFRKDYVRNTIKKYSQDSERSGGMTKEQFTKGITDSINIAGYTVTVLLDQESYDGKIQFNGMLSSDIDYSTLSADSSGKKFEEYFAEAKKDYGDVSSKYPSEKMDSGEYYGEKALYDSAKLAADTGKKDTYLKLLTELIEKYPDGKYRADAEEEIERAIVYNTDLSVYTFKKSKVTVRLVSIREPNPSDASARVIFRKGVESAVSKLVVRGEYIDYSVTDRRYVQLKEILDDKVRVDYNCMEVTGKDSSGKDILTQKNGTAEIGKREGVRICDFRIDIDEINLKKQAQVSILPYIKNAESYVNFTFKVGIEKRAIKLSTDKTKEMIANLNETIKKWEEIKDRLGDVVKGIKGACFATSAFLQVKTLLEGFDGKTMARTQVMRGEGGWAQICEKAVASGQLKVGNSAPQTVSYASVDDCLNKNSDKIEKSVSYVESKIKEENTRIQGLQKSAGISESLLEKTVDTDAYKKKEFDSLMASYKNSATEGVGPNGQKMSVSSVLSKISDKDISALTIEDMKSIQMNERILKENTATDDVKMRAERNLFDTLDKVNRNADVVTAGFDDKLGIKSDNYQDKNAFKAIYRGDVMRNLKVTNKDEIKVDASAPIQVVGYNNKKYVAVLEQDSGNNYHAKSFYELVADGAGYRAVPVSGSSSSGAVVTSEPSVGSRVKDSSGGIWVRESGGWVSEPDRGDYITWEQVKSYGEPITSVSSSGGTADLNSRFSSFSKLDGSSYKNRFKIRPKVRYWETEPYKGMPAFVPVDENTGWYAATKQLLPTFGNVKPFDSSGRVTSFWLCNIGSNGVEEFNQGVGDDICEMINLQTGQATDLFPGLSREEASALVNKAQRLLMEAAEKYSPGMKRVTLSSGTFDVGEPATGQLGTRCQDFMSAKDCYLMFNVCDPVICPTSRCNLGGNYYVDDVVQSGIVGSIALCLPNIKEGIFIPVCLTGIHAGLESYVSILKAHRDCLTESLKSGQHVGLCDEIYSIYLCEFFWRQFAPIVNYAIPLVIQSAYGQGTRGGGEYLTVMNAWQNMEKSTQYFTSYYAANAVKSFQIKNTEEVGTTVCKAFVSTKYPNLKLLLEPESPSQFYAWFNEIPFTDATVPATSQYKVFYHIFAGEDQGVYYSVYLKNPPGTSFYSSNPTVTVATGFIAKGQYADETKDYTAPTGYRELCVRINDKEECGFKQVSTDFTINYAKDKFMEQQATSKVTSEKECISGSSSAYSLIQPNVQEGVQELVTPALYSRGITRICASENPGKTTNPNRWKDVGYCDTEKIRCWIDQEDVKNVITGIGVENKTLNQIDAINVENQFKMTYAEKLEESASDIAAMKTLAGQFNKTFTDNYNLNDLDSKLKENSDLVDVKIGRAVQNNQRVQLMVIKALIYDYASRIVFSQSGLQQKYKDEIEKRRKNVEPAPSTNQIYAEPQEDGSRVSVNGKIFKRANGIWVDESDYGNIKTWKEIQEMGRVYLLPTSDSKTDASVLKFVNTANKDCKNSDECASTCTDNKKLQAAACENPNDQTLLTGKKCKLVSPTAITSDSNDFVCQGNSVCTDTRKTLDRQTYTYATCTSLTIDCTKTIKIYDPTGGAAMFNLIKTDQGFIKDLSMPEIGTYLPVFSAQELISTLNRVKRDCSDGVSNIIIEAHGYPGGFNIFQESINQNWFNTKKAGINNMFDSSIENNHLVFMSCELASNDAGKNFVQDVANYFGTSAYAAPCIMTTCANGVCRLKDPAGTLVKKEPQCKIRFTKSDGAELTGNFKISTLGTPPEFYLKVSSVSACNGYNVFIDFNSNNQLLRSSVNKESWRLVFSKNTNDVPIPAGTGKFTAKLFDKTNTNTPKQIIELNLEAENNPGFEYIEKISS